MLSIRSISKGNGWREVYQWPLSK